MTATTPVLAAHGLTKSFNGNTVLQGLDLKVQDGEFITVMGPSGSSARNSAR